MLGKLCRAEDKNNVKCIYRGSEITLPKIDSEHRETGQDNWGRGDGNSRDRVYEKGFIVMDKIFQTEINLSELRKS